MNTKGKSMSYNITTSDYLSGQLSISEDNLIKARRTFKDKLPECNFIEELDQGEPINGVYVIKNFWWYGEGSGYATGECLEKILAMTTGTAEIILTWEGGDSITGLKVMDGVTAKQRVKQIFED